MTKQGGRCIIVFVKAPVEGVVKTRLAERIGEPAALALYHAFASDTLSAANRVDADVRIYGHPAGWERYARQWTEMRAQPFTQEGADLGARMYNALAKAAADGFTRTILIGSDIPEVTESLLLKALSRLEDHDAVIGPSLDGGYYLVGFSGDTAFREAFTGMAWSGPGVFEETRKRLAENDKTVHVLKPLADIDTYEDLHGLASRLAGRNGHPLRTRRVLAAMKMNPPSGEWPDHR